MPEFYIGLGIIGLIAVGIIITIAKRKYEEKHKEERELKKKYQETLRDFEDI